jgi:hypothetical protein
MNPNLLGGIEVGALVAVILLGMVTVQVSTSLLRPHSAHLCAQIYVYYVNFPHDSLVIKSLVRLSSDSSYPS